MQRTALVTGASRGLGEVIATYLARSGYDLVITARRADALERLAGDLRTYGSKVVAIPGDVADAAHRRRLARAADELGGLDVLVNNASELGPSPMPALTEYPTDALTRVFDVNVIAPISLVSDALPALRARRGLVVNITSDAAVGAYENWGGYGASKAALEPRCIKRPSRTRTSRTARCRTRRCPSGRGCSRPTRRPYRDNASRLRANDGRWMARSVSPR
jgi:NAD(P)-dependent dehydrogenase (short-subunit alcohol dehydrogenase family)